MTIKVFKICLFDGRRIHELYELNRDKAARIRELEREKQTERDFHRVQLKGYGKDFRELLEQIEEHKADEERLKKEIGLLKEMYIQSEKARQHLADRLQKVMKDLTGSSRPQEGKTPPSPAQAPQSASLTAPPEGEPRAAEGIGPCNVQPGVHFDYRKGRIVL